MEMVWLYLVLIPVQHVLAVTWLYLAKEPSLRMVLWDHSGCEGLMGLVEEQVRVCQQQVEAMDAVKQGAELAVKERQRQFHARWWNCSTLQGLQVFGKVAIQDWCHFSPYCRHMGVCFHPRHLCCRYCLCCDSCLQPWGTGEVWL